MDELSPTSFRLKRPSKSQTQYFIFPIVNPLASPAYLLFDDLKLADVHDVEVVADVILLDDLSPGRNANVREGVNDLLTERGFQIAEDEVLAAEQTNPTTSASEPVHLSSLFIRTADC